jgi:S-adenosylmethionine synthetase
MDSGQITVRFEPGPAAAPIEVIERKGLGHPDTLADALAERMSLAYSRHCRERFGAVLHHNLDKLYLRGGHSRTSLGVFEMTAAVTLAIGGRVSTRFAGQIVDHRGLFEQVARDYLATVLPNFDHGQWLRIEHLSTDRSRFPAWFHPQNLGDLPELSDPTASDTVTVTGWWPPTPAEQLTLALERHLNQEGAGPRHRELGQDIKVMTVRRGGHADVTINVAVHPLAAADADAYDAILDKLKAELDEVASRALCGTLDYRLCLNSGDANPYRGKRQYLLGSGSCLEFGEEGFVGRGNTPAGLIPLYRPKSAEAAFGKNPTYHAGKVYTIHADQIARSVHAVTGVPATVTIASRHSDPLRKPHLVDVAVHGEADPSAVTSIAEAALETTDHLTLALDGYLVPR